MSDYSSCDPTKLDHWLKVVSPDLGQYTYQLLLCGVDRQFLSQLSDEQLRDDCRIANGVHRAKILQRARGNSIIGTENNPNELCDTWGGYKTFDQSQTPNSSKLIG